MVMLVGLTLAAIAGPTTCTLPTGIVFAAECSDGRVLTEGDFCVPKCRKNFAPTVSNLACAGGALSPATFSCVPTPRRSFPFRPDQCVPLAVADAVLSGGAAVAGSTITLASGSSAARGIAQWPPVATMGRLVPVEVSFDLSATGAARDGVWVVLTTAGGMTAAATGAQIDPTAVVGVEVDFAVTTGFGDLATPHLAAVYTQDHTAAAELVNVMQSVGTMFDAGASLRVTLLIAPWKGAVAVTTWLAGVTVAYDIAQGSPAMRGLLWGPGASVWPTAVGKSTGAAQLTVGNVRVCGARGKQVWHMFTNVGKIRHCVETWALGNPEAKPGVWRPTRCPPGVPRIIV